MSSGGQVSAASPTKPALIHESLNERRRSSFVDSLRQIVSLDHHSSDSTVRAVPIAVIHYEKATPPSSPGAPQNPPDVLTRRSSTSYSSFTYEKTNRLMYEPTNLNLLSYVNAVVPWTVTLSFIYMLVAALPLAVTSLFSLRSASQAILTTNARLFAVHAHKLHLGDAKNASGAALAALLSPFIAIVVVLLGLLAVVGWAYSILLSEHDDDITCLNLALSLWRNWLTRFYKEETVAEDDFV